MRLCVRASGNWDGVGPVFDRLEALDLAAAGPGSLCVTAEVPGDLCGDTEAGSAAEAADWAGTVPTVVTETTQTGPVAARANTEQTVFRPRLGRCAR